MSKRWVWLGGNMYEDVYICGVCEDGCIWMMREREWEYVNDVYVDISVLYV